MEDSAGGQLGLGIVGGKCSGLPCTCSSKHQSKENHEDLIKGGAGHIAGWQGDLEGGETKHQRVDEVHNCLGEGVGQPIHDRTDHGFPGRKKIKFINGHGLLSKKIKGHGLLSKKKKNGNGLLSQKEKKMAMVLLSKNKIKWP